MIKKTVFIGFLFPMLLSACSNKELFESFQTEVSSCENLPSYKRDACMRKVSEATTYENYTKERNKL